MMLWTVIRCLVPPILLILVLCPLQKLLDGWWAAARRRDLAWEGKLVMARVRWAQAVKEHDLPGPQPYVSFWKWLKDKGTRFFV